MNEQGMGTFGQYAGGGALSVSRNRVLRNNYWLLAVSLLPTVLGAWIGVSTGITAAMGTGMSLIVFLVGALGLIYAIEKTKNSSAGVYVLLGLCEWVLSLLSRLRAHPVERDSTAPPRPTE